jgi:hypothetical protein
MIERLSGVLRLSRVPVPHTNDATYAVDARGRHWVAKREADMGCEALAAEAITWMLARVVGMPVPEAAFCDDPGERAWLSAWVTDAKHWSVGTAGVIRNPAAAAAILALDAVVFNEARHGGNLLLVPDLEGGSTVVAIDADEALIGHPAELTRRGLVSPDPRILARGFPPADWRKFALDAAQRLGALPAADLAVIAAEGCSIAREPDQDLMAQVLIARCGAALTLTRGYMDRVEARR